MLGGGPTFDRVIANEHAVYVRIYVIENHVWAFAIMTNNDVLQTKYIVTMTNRDIPTLSSTSIGDSVYIVIENVTKHMGTTYNDADMSDLTTITINNSSNSNSYGTWTSTIEPDNVTVELNCVVVDNSNYVVIAKCDSDITWPKSVFNRVPIWADNGRALFGYSGNINYAMFGTRSFSFNGSIPSSWNESILYDVTGHESNLTIGDGDDKVTIMGLPESFVSYWVNMGAQAYMGNGRAMLVPPDL